MRNVDADHLRERILKEDEHLVNREVFLDMVDTEPDSDESNSIQWLPTRRQRRTKDVYAITYGVECSRCHNFEMYEKRFCCDCGGKFNGELPKKNTYAERKFVRRV